MAEEYRSINVPMNVLDLVSHCDVVAVQRETAEKNVWSWRKRELKLPRYSDAVGVLDHWFYKVQNHIQF